MTSLRTLTARAPATDRLDAAWDAIVRRRELRRARRRWVAGAAMASALILVLYAVFGSLGRGLRPIALQGGAPLPSVFHAEAPVDVALDDGSRIALGPQAELTALPSEEGRVHLRLERGRATFDVKPGGLRAWLIDAGSLHVRVLGTRFAVSRDGARASVAVERGRVAVESDEPGFVARTLGAGESAETAAVGARATAIDEPSSAPIDPARLAPPRASLPPEASSPESAPAVAPERATTNAIAEARTPSPQERRPSAPVSEPSADALLREADEARARGDLDRAVAILERVVERAPTRPAALAAFTLGKVHADDRADPAIGARWFDRAASSGLPSALAEQASARAVEAYDRAGLRAESLRAGRRYVERFPNGPQRARVDAWMRD